MSDKRATLRERTQRFRRRMRGQDKAVSPVVATLILILIAVAAAAALYLWLVAWQGNITGGIGNQGIQATFTIGGSTSVYPFSSLAVSWFEQNHSDVAITDDQGGTGAGMLAVCAGHIDVGAASSLETVAGLEASDGCPTTPGITITTIAYDAVDVIVPAANDHGLVSVSFDTLALIYADQSVVEKGVPTLIPNSENGVSIPTGIPTTTTVASPGLLWAQIPGAVNGASVKVFTAAAPCNVAAGCTITQAADSAAVVPLSGTGALTGADDVACGTVGTSGPYYDICDVGADAAAADTGTSCGFVFCAGGTGAAAPGTAGGYYGSPIVTVARSDASGTTQTFEARLLGAGSSSGGTNPTEFVGTTSLAAATASFTSLGFGGCGSNNFISDCGYVAVKTGTGNPGVISTVAGNPDALGYASDGLARASSSGVTCAGVSTAACGIGLSVPGQTSSSTGVQSAPLPSLGASGSIAGGIVNGGFGTPGLTTTLSIAASYGGARPFEFVTLQPPAGEVSDFFTFITAPDVNQNLATATGEVSIYSI